MTTTYLAGCAAAGYSIPMATKFSPKKLQRSKKSLTDDEVSQLAEPRMLAQLGTFNPYRFVIPSPHLYLLAIKYPRLLTCC